MKMEIESEYCLISINFFSFQKVSFGPASRAGPNEMKKLIDIKQYSDSIFHWHVFLMHYFGEKILHFKVVLPVWPNRESCFEEKVGYKIWYPIWYQMTSFGTRFGTKSGTKYNALWKRLLGLGSGRADTQELV